jgi:hypothetical protein
MGRQIIKQPDGRYCIFSTTVDDLIYYDCTAQDLIEISGSEAMQEAEEATKRKIMKVETKKKPYFQFTMDCKEVRRLYNRAKKAYAEKAGLFYVGQEVLLLDTFRPERFAVIIGEDEYGVIVQDTILGNIITRQHKSIYLLKEAS